MSWSRASNSAHSPADVSGADEDPPVSAGQRIIPNLVPHVINVQVIGAQHVSVASTHCRRHTHTTHLNVWRSTPDQQSFSVFLNRETNYILTIATC